MKKNLFYFLFAFMLLILVVLTYHYTNQKVESNSDLQDHTQKVLQVNNLILIDVLNIETNSRGYSLTQNDLFLGPFNQAIFSVQQNLLALNELIHDDDIQKIRVQALKNNIIQRSAMSKKLVAMSQSYPKNFNLKNSIIEEGTILSDSIKQGIRLINSKTLSLFKSRKADNQNSIRNTGIIFLLLLILLFGLFAGTFILLQKQKIITQAAIELESKVSLRTYEVNKELKLKELEAIAAKEKIVTDYSRSLIEASRDPLVTISVEGKIMDMNKAMLDVTEKNRETLTGANFFDHFTDPQKAREVYEEVFLKGFVVDYPLTMKDGKLTDVLFNGSTYKDGQGNVLGAVVVARDLTQQKKIEKDLTQSLKEISDYKFALDASSIVDVTDQNDIIKFVNDNFCKISKYTAEELIGSNHRIINSGFHSKEFMSVLWKTISSGKIWRDELKNRSKDGNIYWVLTTIVPFLNDHGIPYQYMAIRTDITKQKSVEAELIEARIVAELATGMAEEEKSKAQDAMKAKQQFLSNMSHEIRTPMNAIIGFTKVVLKTDLSAKQKEYLTAIKMSGDTLIVLINDILDLAKVDAGKMKFEQNPFKLSLSLAAMLHLFEAKIQEKNLALDFTYDYKIPEVLLGDPVRLHQIMLNLLSNAVKFTSKGRVAVKVQTLKEDAEKTVLEFSISDTGIGIPANRIATIFENFQQASSETSRLYGGTGLGLAIAKQLVEAQGGRIWVKSTLGEGATFSFVLSFLKTDAEAAFDAPIAELDTEIKNIKVLVAEDMALNQLLMKTLLDDFGFERDIADNGKIAIEKLQAKSYDIILMDLQMPEMNGFEATEYIRTTMNSKIPIIALTADVTTADLAKCTAVGMNDYIAKPIDERVLYSKIIGLVKKNNPREGLNLPGNDQRKNIKYTDLDYLIQRTKNNPELMMEMITAFLEQTPPLIDAIKLGLQEQNWDLLQAAVHKIIPSFSIMGIPKDFENVAKKIQTFARLQQQTEDIHHLVLEIENVCRQACKELEIEFIRIKDLQS
jgi:PAS domain S-box-containing protein